MPIVLPEKFHDGHNLTFILHDMLVDHAVACDRAGLLFFRAPLHRPEDGEEMSKCAQGLEFWEWCEKNGYRHLLDKYTYRVLMFQLLTDMCHFLHEALTCSAKGKLTVAFSILRKPLQDNLFYLEWMLADWPGFLAAFREGPDALDWGRMDSRLRKSKRIDIIGKAMDAAGMGRWIDPEFLYELRYEKASDAGFDPLFNKALHLVTGAKYYATDPENINFIFCDDDDHDELWMHLYKLLPSVLLHARQVVGALCRTLDPTFSVHEPFADLWIIVGYFLWAESLLDEDRHVVMDTLTNLFADDDLACPACGAVWKRLEISNLKAFWETGSLTCPSCLAVIPLLTLHDAEEPAQDCGELHDVSGP